MSGRPITPMGFNQKSDSEGMGFYPRQLFEPNLRGSGAVMPGA
jgi:hypothetical protein